MLTYKGVPLRRIQSVPTVSGKETMYYIETWEKFSCVVPLGSIGSDDGVEETIRVANRTRGNILEREGKTLCLTSR